MGTSEIIESFLTGAVLGAIFSFFNLAIPAPSTLAGILGLVGIFAGYILVKFFVR